MLPLVEPFPVVDTSDEPYRNVVMLAIERDDGTRVRHAGVLINENHVLTSAHNLLRRAKAGDYRARAISVHGCVANEHGDAPPIEAVHGFYPQAFVAHPLYPDRCWDVAVLRLAREAGREPFIKPCSVRVGDFPVDPIVLGYPRARQYRMVRLRSTLVTSDYDDRLFYCPGANQTASSGSPLIDTHTTPTRLYGVLGGDDDDAGTDRSGIFFGKASLTFVRTALYLPETPGQFLTAVD
ncbi:trypsin-like serine peptidase [Trinickia fusca]|uniref:Peptidase S1 domain-containing protein n=1 Tax=Trinickia fusca TaxID=2419777 RepID=A0A494X947_9BURK|nr:serine protease [Trinickia fusca]RKP44609.1 hypothetical protein D7S89_22330 [Trinickia fusca]